jgi:hypothetical protein
MCGVRLPPVLVRRVNPILDRLDHPPVERPLLMVTFRQPSHEFTFGVDMSFILYPLVLTLLVQQVYSCMLVLEFSVYAGF